MTPKKSGLRSIPSQLSEYAANDGVYDPAPQEQTVLAKTLIRSIWWVLKANDPNGYENIGRLVLRMKPKMRPDIVNHFATGICSALTFRDKNQEIPEIKPLEVTGDRLMVISLFGHMLYRAATGRSAARVGIMKKISHLSDDDIILVINTSKGCGNPLEIFAALEIASARRIPAMILS